MVHYILLYIITRITPHFKQKGFKYSNVVHFVDDGFIASTNLPAAFSKASLVTNYSCYLRFCDFADFLDGSKRNLRTLSPTSSFLRMKTHASACSISYTRTTFLYLWVSYEPVLLRTTGIGDTFSRSATYVRLLPVRPSNSAATVLARNSHVDRNNAFGLNFSPTLNEKRFFFLFF